MTDAESDETQARARGDEAGEAAAAETLAAIGADDETTVVPDVTQQAHALAWSTAENPALDSDDRHPLPRALKLLLVAVSVAALALAAFVIGQRSSPRQPPATPGTAGSSSTAAPARLTPPPAAPPAAKPPPDDDDDQYVAMALSPSAIGKRHVGGYGTAGNQDEANRIAMSECRTGSGDDDCLLINGGKHHGCVAYAIDESGEAKWSSASGADRDEARTKARNKLDSSAPVYTAVQCSNPPGVLKPSQMVTAPAAAPDTQTVPVAPPPPPINVGNPAADQLYLRLLQQIPGTVIADPATALAGGPKVCTSLVSNGRTATNSGVQANDPGTALWQAQAIVNAAITAYCPAYANIP
jgi:hypothetical protein